MGSKRGEQCRSWNSTEVAHAVAAAAAAAAAEAGKEVAAVEIVGLKLGRNCVAT